MAQKQRIYVYDIPTIPDCTHHSLVTLCGGNVREHVFRACEHLLRMVANFKEDQLALAIRFLFCPEMDEGIQQRLRLQLGIKVGESISEDTVRQLIDSGPLAEFYEIAEPRGPLNKYGLGFNFPAICEVIHQEERVKPLIPKEQNPGRIPSLYYSLHPFEARADNDYLMVDTLLSKMKNPCLVEILVCPTDQAPELESQYKYITRLMSVNQYDGDFYANLPTDNFFQEDSPQQQSTLSIERKRDPMADDIAREHQEFHRTLRQPQLLFNIKAFAMNEENALMLASAIAECGFSSGKYNLVSYNNNGSEEMAKWLEDSLNDSQTMNISLQAMYPRVWDKELPSGYRGMARLCRMGTVDELKGIFRLPVGGYGSPRCIRKFTDPKIGETEDNILIGDDLESEQLAKRDFKKSLSNLSKVFNNTSPPNLELRLPLKSLTKHMFIAGVPGSGKTTAVYNILVQLFRHRKPFLVIEPTKTEYRILKTLQNHKDKSVCELANQLRIYSPGNDTVSPFRFNPLSYQKGITLDEHIGQILSCFDAAMPMGGPLQALIAEAVEEVYKDRDTDDFPQMTDLVRAASQVMVNKKYEGEIKSNLQAAIEVRLGMLTKRAMGRIFLCKNSIPSIEELLKEPTVIEMDYLSQDHACLLTLFLLSAIREQIKVDPNRQARDLHHVTVIEEAHNIVGRTGSAKASEEIADPKAFAAQYVSRLLAELRALGEGMIIADQLPSAVASEVVKNTGTKLAHRLVSNEDREDLGGAMLFGGTETEEIARFSTGEAYFYTEGLYRPRRVRCLNAYAYLELKDSINVESIISLITKEKWFNENRFQRISTLKKFLRDTLSKAIKIIQEYRIDLDDLTAKCDDLRDISQDNDEVFKEQRQQLINDSLSLQMKIGQAVEDFDACFRLADNLDDNTSRELTKMTKSPVVQWQKKIKPTLVELKHDFCLIQLNIPKIESV